MLSDILNLEQIDATQIMDFLYDIFHRDFVSSRTYLADKIYINPRSQNQDEGKEKDFWHLTTREIKEKVWVNRRPVWQVVDRYPDFRRSERLEWVKQILTNHNHESIKMFYHRETNKKRDIRLYLWAYDSDFVVILQKLGKSSSFLVTSFYVDNEGKVEEYEKRYENYSSGDKDLANCEWF